MPDSFSKILKEDLKPNLDGVINAVIRHGVLNSTIRRLNIDDRKINLQAGVKRFWPETKSFILDADFTTYGRSLFLPHEKLIALVQDSYLVFVSLGKISHEDEEKINQLARFFRPPINRSLSTPVGIMVETKSGNTIRSFELPNYTLHLDNYPEQVQKGLEKFLDSLENPKTSGRLTLLEGAPGTGKTSALRGVMSSFCGNDAPVFVVLPQDIAHSISNPSVISVLQEAKVEMQLDDNTGKLVLVIEDGDILLQRRDNGYSAVTDFLNLCDGILGEILQLHIVVTTNLKTTDFDPAITRPGRLNSIIHFHALNKYQAERIITRENGAQTQLFGIELDKKEYTLAEVYALIRGTNNGIEPSKEALGQYL